VLVQEASDNATSSLAVYCQETDPSLAVHPLRPREPLRFGKLGLFLVCGAECMRGILQRTKTYRFEGKSIQGSDWANGDHDSRIKGGQEFTLLSRGSDPIVVSFTRASSDTCRSYLPP